MLNYTLDGYKLFFGEKSLLGCVTSDSGLKLRHGNFGVANIMSPQISWTVSLEFINLNMCRGRIVRRKFHRHSLKTFSVNGGDFMPVFDITESDPRLFLAVFK